MLPLARALQTADHQVAFATAERFCRNVVEPAGFAAFPAGLSPLQAQEALARNPAGAARAEAWPEGSQGGQDRGAESGAGAAPSWRFGAALFAGPAAPAKADDLAGVIRAWSPDLVVNDAFDFGAPLAAAAAGLVHASHSFGAIQAPELWDLAGVLVEGAWRERGMEPVLHGGIFLHMYIDVCPPSLQAPNIGDIAVARPMRPVGPEPGAPEPPWLAGLGGRPCIYVTMGTVFNTTPGLFETVLGALAGEDLDVVVTLGPGRDPAGLGPQPANVRVLGYVPQSVVLPRADLVVCHGGSGTTLAALAHGVPLLILPQGANQEWNAQRCAAIGAGAMLGEPEATQAAVRGRVRQLLSQPRYREAAGAVRAEIAAMPEPAAMVETLEELATQGPG